MVFRGGSALEFSRVPTFEILGIHVKFFLRIAFFIVLSAVLHWMLIFVLLDIADGNFWFLPRFLGAILGAYVYVYMLGGPIFWVAGVLLIGLLMFAVSTAVRMLARMWR